MDAAINVSVVRPHPVLAFQVNMVGGVQRGQSLRRLRHKKADPHRAFSHLPEPQRRLLERLSKWKPTSRCIQASDLYALSKYLGGHITRVFAEREGLEVLSFVYTHFRPREVPARGTGKWRASLRDFVGGYWGGVFVWVEGTRDAVAVARISSFVRGCRTTSTGPTRPSDSWSGKPRIGLRRCMRGLSN